MYTIYLDVHDSQGGVYHVHDNAQITVCNVTDQHTDKQYIQHFELIDKFAFWCCNERVKYLCHIMPILDHGSSVTNIYYLMTNITLVYHLYLSNLSYFVRLLMPFMLYLFFDLPGEQSTKIRSYTQQLALDIKGWMPRLESWNVEIMSKYQSILLKSKYDKSSYDVKDVLVDTSNDIFILLCLSLQIMVKSVS